MNNPKIYRSSGHFKNSGSMVNKESSSLENYEKVLNSIADHVLSEKIKEIEDEFNNRPDIIPYTNQTQMNSNDTTKINLQPNIIKQNQEKELGIYDSKLRDTIYEQSEKYERRLTKKYGDTIKDKQNEEDLKDFKQSPYGWIKTDLEKSIRNSKVDLAIAKDNIQKKEIEEKIKENGDILKLLDQAYKKNIPLKLDRNFNSQEITLDNGNLFKVGQYTTEINKYIGKENSLYEIIGIVQRRNDDFLILKTNNGDTVELNTKVALKILSEKEVIKENNEVLDLQKEETTNNIEKSETELFNQKLKICIDEQNKLNNELMRVSLELQKIKKDLITQRQKDLENSQGK